MGIRIKEISFRTLTPLWSGGESGECEDGDLLETSILGSLRWWLEALARGYGISVPDPTERDVDESASCVDSVFGHTGRKRSFRLEIDSSSVRIQPIRWVIESRDVDREEWSRWYFPGSKSFVGNRGSDGRQAITARLIATVIRADSAGPSFGLECIQGLLSFIARWGALGAKNQHGFGVIDYQSREGAIALRDWLEAERSKARSPGGTSLDLPSVDRFFCFTLTVRNPFNLEDSEERQKRTIDLRQFLRAYLRDAADLEFHHRVMGFVKKDSNKKDASIAPASGSVQRMKDEDKRHGSRVFVSMPYLGGSDQIMRVWGWDSEVGRVIERISKLCSDYGREFSLDSSFGMGDPGFATIDYAKRLLDEVAK